MEKFLTEKNPSPRLLLLKKKIMIPCICIDDKKRPDKIPVEKWVKKDQEYHIINVYWMVKQKFQGVDLAEIELDETHLPYNCFAAKRFAIDKKDVEAYIELCKASTEMNDTDIDEMVRELTRKERELVPAERELELTSFLD